jgi:hypothetical protein
MSLFSTFVGGLGAGHCLLQRTYAPTRECGRERPMAASMPSRGYTAPRGTVMPIAVN